MQRATTCGATATSACRPPHRPSARGRVAVHARGGCLAVAARGWSARVRGGEWGGEQLGYDGRRLGGGAGGGGWRTIVLGAASRKWVLGGSSCGGVRLGGGKRGTEGVALSLQGSCGEGEGEGEGEGCG